MISSSKSFIESQTFFIGEESQGLRRNPLRRTEFRPLAIPAGLENYSYLKKVLNA